MGIQKLLKLYWKHKQWSKTDLQLTLLTIKPMWVRQCMSTVVLTAVLLVTAWQNSFTVCRNERSPRSGPVTVGIRGRSRYSRWGLISLVDWPILLTLVDLVRDCPDSTPPPVSSTLCISISSLGVCCATYRMVWARCIWLPDQGTCKLFSYCSEWVPRLISVRRCKQLSNMRNGALLHRLVF